MCVCVCVCVYVDNKYAKILCLGYKIEKIEEDEYLFLFFNHMR